MPGCHGNQFLKSSKVLLHIGLQVPTVVKTNCRQDQPRAVGVVVLVYFNKIISLPVPLLYYVFDLSVLLHKIPNICRFYPCLSMFFHAFSVFDRDLSVIYTPNGKTAEPESYRRAAKVKERMDRKHFQVARKRST